MRKDCDFEIGRGIGTAGLTASNSNLQRSIDAQDTAAGTEAGTETGERYHHRHITQQPLPVDRIGSILPTKTSWKLCFGFGK